MLVREVFSSTSKNILVSQQIEALFSWLASLGSGIFKAAQTFSQNSLSCLIICVKMLFHK